MLFLVVDFCVNAMKVLSYYSKLSHCENVAGPCHILIPYLQPFVSVQILNHIPWMSGGKYMLRQRCDNIPPYSVCVAAVYRQRWEWDTCVHTCPGYFYRTVRQCPIKITHL